VANPVAMTGQPSSPPTEAVRRFLSRRKWRHVLAMGAGVVALTLGSAIVAAHLVHVTLPQGTPGITVGAALYSAGVLTYAYGGAAGAARRLPKWFFGTAVLGLLAVAIFSLAGLLPDEAGDVAYAQQQGATGGAAVARLRPPRPRWERGAGSGLAARLITPREVDRLLGPNTAPPRSHTLRNRAIATWTNPARRPGSQRLDRAKAARNRRILTLTVGRSRWQANQMRNGHLPAGAQRLPGLGEAGYVHGRVRAHSITTRVRAVQGTWVVAAQLTSPVTGDPTPLLAADVAEALDVLSAATSG
jgi:hypothetical protein